MPSKRSGADRTFVGHRLTPEARRALDEWSAQKGGLSEDDLFRGYSGPERRAHVRIAQDALRRPQTAVHDESGLVYGEPLSRGRTVRQKETDD